MAENHRIVLFISEKERQDMLAWSHDLSAQAEAHTQSCIDILVKQHGADPTRIDMEIFRESYTGQVIGYTTGSRAEPPQTPEESVAWALKNIRERYLGLKK